ncbi:MAG: BrnA antitoxin family protein [Rhodoferax sp.]|nr:BrnA antitoxin family protein [Rhodoferax sp.]
MNARAPLIDDDGEVRELTAEDFKHFKPAREVLGAELYAMLTKQRGPQKAALKVPTTIRFDADVLAAVKATGKGWQTRVNDAMREWVRSHPVG